MAWFIRAKLLQQDQEKITCQLPSGEIISFPYSAQERKSNEFFPTEGEEIVITVTRGQDLLNEILKDSSVGITNDQTTQNKKQEEEH